MRLSFGSRLAEAVQVRGSLCVGVDPSPELLAGWGLPDDARGLREFAMRAVDVLAASVAVVKPQAAFFERHGEAGMAVLREVVDAARDRGALVLLDAKRGDIGSTSEAYADAYLAERAPIRVDAMTVNPYLGFDAIAPFANAARASEAGLFVLARTSNPGGTELQSALLDGGRTVAHEVIARVAALNDAGESAGSFGIVFGATIDTAGYGLDTFAGPILAPGLGAQGATPEDVVRRFRDCPGVVLPSASREVLGVGPDPDALRDRARKLSESCRRVLVHD